jgi:uncharacterized caspase-like protein
MTEVGRRVVLVIGNAAYEHAELLKNPINDADAIAKALTRLRFSVFGGGAKLNLNGKDLRAAFLKFGAEADGADMAIIYFAGHGLEVRGRNFLIPVDAKLDRSHGVEFETTSLDQVLTAVEGAHPLRLVILDACRDNPFRSHMLRAEATRALGKGLRPPTMASPCGRI